ncbi:hypothetical protein GUITHDRAFT_144920 [Guillardia theta CCMP2712]|uniref:Uncharacterized protein n=1 Tax=Guillardia theta (strain CCMP2712) TaxID=905079 RepID=L1IMJ1_GUITC|nr:hypothetical protein GUITHDRAFT_144920 [Guillardia theta CCMP2712]EKX37481.1 hypothetical protein GUITHDRAFT_144920 [Guillardia theta CCMP2712]|eukprot:XP_005824461.1 hypothetical protein GUITHDRAFT_144920 [Guillardia theta CCMP2712]
MLPAAGCLAVLVLLFFHGGCAADSLDDLMLRHRIAVQGPFVLTDGNLVEVEGGRMKILLAEGAADVELKFVLLSEDVALEEVEGEDEQGGSGLVEIMLGERRLAALKVVKVKRKEAGPVRLTVDAQGEGRGTFYRVLRSRIGAAGDNGGEKGREEKVTVRLVQGPRSVELTSVLLLLEQRQEEQSICPAGEDEEGEQEVEVHAQGGETGRDRTPAACSALCGDFSTLIREQEAS